MDAHLGIEPSPFASEAAVLETACAPYTSGQKTFCETSFATSFKISEVCLLAE